MKVMDTNSWVAIAEQIEAGTTLSQRQSEVFVLSRLGRYRSSDIAEMLDISPTTVSRHIDELNTKVEQSRELAQMWDNDPFCNEVATAECRSICVQAFENLSLPDGNRDLPPEQYQMVTHRTEHDDGVRTTTTTRTRFSSPMAVLDSLQNGDGADDFIEAACIFSVIDEMTGSETDLPLFGTLFEGDPTQREMETVVQSGIVAPEDIRPFTDINQRQTGTTLGTQLGTPIPVDFDVRKGDVTCVMGNIGAGKSHTVKTLLSRLIELDDSPQIVCVDVLDSFSGFMASLDGQEFHVGEDVDALREEMSTGLDSLTRVDIDTTGTSDDVSVGDVVHRVVAAVCDQADADGRETIVAIDEAHVMHETTWNHLMAQAADSSSSVQSWIPIFQTLESVDIFNAEHPAEPERDGFILHKWPDIAGIDGLLGSDQREFVRTATSGKADAVKTALVSAPGTASWLPTEIDPSLDELAVISDARN